ncbi:MAG: glycosyltransferase family 2 protein [Planctomycetaceae bacterium]
MSHAKLSVVMANYNHAHYLPGAIEAVLGQTRPADEFLILDDASTDSSIEIIASYAARHPVIRFLRNPANLGVVGAHRRLFEESTGDYVCTIAADDRHLPRYYERGMELAERHPQAGIIFGKVGIIDEADRELAVLGVRRWQNSGYFTPEQFRREYLEVEAPSHSLSAATIFRRDAFAEVGWYPPDLGSWSDTFALRAIGLKHGACYINETVTRWRRSTASFSGKSRANPRHTLDLVARAARLMRSGEFRDRFPEEHVHRWERDYRRLVMWNAWQGEGLGFRPKTVGFWLNFCKRLPKLPAALRLAFYRPPQDDGAT